ncbi:MAG: MFS transporter [Chthonomonadales bacterium]
MPVLLAKLGASDPMIGFSRFLEVLGFTLPALLAAHAIHGLKFHKPVLLRTLLISRSGMLVLPIVLVMFGLSHPKIVLAIFFVLYGAFWLMDGYAAVSWFDIVAKCIPEKYRGRFLGVMSMTGGIAAIGSGLAVALILKAPSLAFPNNFALLLTLFLTGCFGSQFFLSLIREPEGSAMPEEERPTFGVFVKKAGPLLKHNPDLRTLVIARMCLAGAGMAAPFYALFAQRNLGVSIASLGVYAAVKSVGRVGTGPLWGWLSDRHTACKTYRWVAVGILLIPVSALAAGTGMPWFLPIAFLAMGSVSDGIWMVGTNVLFETVHETDRPLAVGVASLLHAPASLFGVIGGLLLQATDFKTVFVVSMLFGVAGTALAWKLSTGGDRRKSGQVEVTGV